MRASNRLLVSCATLAVAATAAIPALAAGGHKGKGSESAAAHKGAGSKGAGGSKGAPGNKHAKLLIKGGSSVKINKYSKDSVHWTPGNVTVPSGATLTIANMSPDPDPHTFSIVNKSQLPRTLQQAENCKVCEQIAQAHGVNPREESHGPPPIPTVEPGKNGFDEAGDSQFIGPHQTVKVKITAKPGTKLYFMCAVHPWMQGVVKVVK